MERIKRLMVHNLSLRKSDSLWATINQVHNIIILNGTNPRGKRNLLSSIFRCCPTFQQGCQESMLYKLALFLPKGYRQLLTS